MEFARSNRFFSPFTSSSSTTVTYAESTPTKQIPITIQPNSSPQPSSSAAAKIQAAYRAHVVRRLVKKISSIRSETERLQRLIQRQETVDSLLRDQRVRLTINEELMRQLLALDSISGKDPAVREARRNLSRRIVGLQEIVDGICNEKASQLGRNGGWWDWDEVLEEMEVEMCRERGGDELERFCAEQLGFRCFQRFLRH